MTKACSYKKENYVMAKKSSETLATKWLKKNNISFTEHVYNYEDKGGANDAAHKLGLAPHLTIKTLIMEDEKKQPLIILMHGDHEVSTKNLARQTNTKHIQPCDPATAQRHSGYLVGGTSPFGTRKTMPIWVQKTILELDKIYVNGGKRGLLVGLNPNVLTVYLHAHLVDVALP